MVRAVRVDIDGSSADAIPRLCEDALENALDSIGDKTVVSITQSQVESTYDASDDHRSNYVSERSILYTIVYKA